MQRPNLVTSDRVKKLLDLAVARGREPRKYSATEKSFVSFGDRLFEVFCGKQDNDPDTLEMKKKNAAEFKQYIENQFKTNNVPPEIRQLIYTCWEPLPEHKPNYHLYSEYYKKISDVLDNYIKTQELIARQKEEKEKAELKKSQEDSSLPKIYSEIVNRAASNDKADEKFGERLLIAFKIPESDQRRIQGRMPGRSAEFGNIPSNIRELLINCFNEEEYPTYKTIVSELREAFPQLDKSKLEEISKDKKEENVNEQKTTFDPVAGLLELANEKVTIEKYRFGREIRTFLEGLVELAKKSPDAKPGKELGIKLFDVFCTKPFESYDDADRKKISEGFAPAIGRDEYNGYLKRAPDKISEAIFGCLRNDPASTPTYKNICQIMVEKSENLRKVFASRKSIQEAMAINRAKDRLFSLGGGGRVETTPDKAKRPSGKR